MNTVAQSNHAAHTVFRGFVEVGTHHAAVFSVVHIAIYNGVRVILHVRVGGNRCVDSFSLTDVGQLSFSVLAADMLYRFMEQISKINVWKRLTSYVFFVAVHHIVEFQSAENHFGVFCKIAVYGDSIRYLSEVYPLGFDGMRPEIVVPADLSR